jgi:hypothetical protein
MKKYYVLALAILVVAGAGVRAAEATVDWNPCKEDIAKFRCKNAETDDEKYRCLIRNDELSKACYAVTTEYERKMSGQ